MSIITSTLYLLNRHITIWYGNIFIPLCVVTLYISYCKIFLTLRHHQTQVYKKAVSSALWVQCTLVACYLPYGIVRAMHSNSKLYLSNFLAGELTVTLVYFNSSLNPFLYCWKIREVKQAVKQTIREALCCRCVFFLQSKAKNVAALKTVFAPFVHFTYRSIAKLMGYCKCYYFLSFTYLHCVYFKLVVLDPAFIWHPKLAWALYLWSNGFSSLIFTDMNRSVTFAAY